MAQFFCPDSLLAGADAAILGLIAAMLKLAGSITTTILVKKIDDIYNQDINLIGLFSKRGNWPIILGFGAFALGPFRHYFLDPSHSRPGNVQPSRPRLLYRQEIEWKFDSHTYSHPYRSRRRRYCWP